MMIDRQAKIIEIANGKKVLHIGCCDTPYCRESVASKSLLHMKLQNISSELWGVDIDSHDIEFLENEFGMDNLLVGDAEKLERSFPPDFFDVIIAGEIIEHLKNPGLFLEGAKKILRDNGELVISVPNGVAFRRGFKSLFGKETVHPDHNFWFSRKTLVRLLGVSGFEIKEIHGYRLKNKSHFGAYLMDLLSCLFSQWACEGIVAVASPANDSVNKNEGIQNT